MILISCTIEIPPKNTLTKVRNKNSNWIIGSPWYPNVYKKFAIDIIKTTIKNNFFIFKILKWISYFKKIDISENKKPTTIVVGFLLRRKRDSNPRTCYSQQFSRLPHSTTLPFLRSCFTIKYSGCKYRKGFHFVKAFLLFLIE